MIRRILLILLLLWATDLQAQDKTIPLDLQAQADKPDLAAVMPDSAQNVPPAPPVQKNKSFAPNAGPNAPEVDTKRSLSENFKNNAPEEDEDDTDDSDEPQKKKSWVGELLSNGLKTKEQDAQTVSPLVSALDGVQTTQRSNASVFDISGVMLRMSYEQAEAALLKRGYKKTVQKLDIPNFIRWRNEERCRNQGVIGYERINGCVIKLARQNKYEYVAQAQFNKYDTQETVQFFLTSTFTHNKIYKITYRTEASNNGGNSAKALYLRNIKVYDFWKKINQKYGVPDDQDNVIWTLGQNKPYLKAATGFLLLEDPMLRELDYTRMSREDQLFMNTDLYTF
jgi:hypothetical protein